MAKFKYYITSLFEGKIVGTNDQQIAQSFADTEDAFVLDLSDPEQPAWMLAEGDGALEIEEAKDPR